MSEIGSVTVKVKILGVGGKRRVRFLSFIARILGVALDVKEDV